jgi:voltage-gated potassium channel
MRLISQRYYQLRIALAMLLGVILLGSLGYMIIEGWNLLDSVYMTIISITTTGYREVYPLSQFGKVFTIIIIVLGVVTIAYTGGRLAQLFVESY